jgi:hypothetical protein
MEIGCLLRLEPEKWEPPNILKFRLQTVNVCFSRDTPAIRLRKRRRQFNRSFQHWRLSEDIYMQANCVATPATQSARNRIVILRNNLGSA